MIIVPKEGAIATANAFVSARKSATALVDYPGDLPETLDAAYAIQGTALRLSGGAVGGWKVGRIWPPLSEKFGADRLSGPIFADMIGNGSDPVGQIFAGGFGAAEAEFLIRIGTTPPSGQRRFTAAEASALIDAVHVGIEIASSPFAGINDLGPVVTVSDFGNNNGLIIGPQIADWHAAGFADWPVTLVIDGTEVGQGTAAAFPGGPLGAVCFLLENLASRGISVAAGTWISTGAITGVHPVTAGQQVVARFGDALTIGCRIETARPR